MSVEEIEEALYSASEPLAVDNPFAFRLGLDISTPALTPESSFTFGQYPSLKTDPSTPPEPTPGGSYWYSPATTPFDLTSPSSDYSEYQPNYELAVGFPRSEFFMKDQNMAPIRNSGFLAGDHSLCHESHDNGPQLFETSWDETVNRTPPPTPSTEDSIDLVLRNSPASAHTTTSAPKLAPRSGRAPRKRKVPAEKRDRPKVPKITQPLSILTADYHHIPIRRMEDWVNRSQEQRWEEVKTRDGYVTRPMNSFMLYRSAFSERTKLWCLQNNHQVVSSISGISWPLEPDEIRNKYNNLAKLERENHHKAHPGYKFSPTKNQNGVRKPKRKKSPKSPQVNDEDDTISANSDVDETNHMGDDGSPAVRPKKSARSAKRVKGAPAGNSLAHMGFPYDTSSGGAIRSSFNHNNPGKTPPMSMGAQDMSGQYYQTTVRASSAKPIPNPMPGTLIEDVTVRRTQTPGSSTNYTQLTKNHIQLLPIKSEPGEDSNLDPALREEGAPSGGDDFMVDQYSFMPQQSASNFAFDALFADTSQMLGSPFSTEPIVGAQNDMMGFVNIESCTMADVQKLPGYSETMGDFLDTQESWSVEEQDDMGNTEPCYDEWLQ